MPEGQFDQVAVFDLILGNLDRHGGNILLSGDLAKEPQLVPIDHGTSMPSVETLKLNRHRIMNPRNILLDLSFEQGNQTLSPVARAALGAIDPTALAQALSGSQARLAGRHDEARQPWMGLANPQIKLMTRTVQFMQAAADRLTVRDLFAAKSRYLDEIMAEPEPDWNALAARVQGELASWQAAVVKVGEIVPITRSMEEFPLESMQNLGWCMGMTRTEAGRWVVENAERAHKILAGRIVNPQRQAEVDALRGLVGDSSSVDPNCRPANRSKNCTDSSKGIARAALRELSIARRPTPGSKAASSNSTATRPPSCAGT